MQCLGCGREVHPVQEMIAGADGNMRGFTNRCPHIECGATLPIEEPVTVQADASEEIRMLETEMHLLDGEEQTEESTQTKARLRARLHMLRNPRPKVPPKSTPRPAPVPEPPAALTPGVVPASAASAMAALAAGNIIHLLRSRLVELDLEAKQIRAMLAAADAVS